MFIIQRTALLMLFLCFAVYAQNESVEDSIDVYIIDSFIPPDNPNVFKLSFFTSIPAKSKVMFDNEFEFSISDTLSDSHKIEIDLTKINFKSKVVPYVITVEDETGKTNQSELFEFELREEIKMESESNFLLLCLFGGTVFLLPSPVFVVTENDNYFSLTKEIPL